jgi:hypothetical protein
VISTIFFVLLASIRSEGLFFLVIFLIINTAYNLAILRGSFSRKNIRPIDYEDSLTGQLGNATDIYKFIDTDNPVDEGNPAVGHRKYENVKTAKSDLSINDYGNCNHGHNKSINPAERRNTILAVAVSITLPAALIFLLLTPWAVLRAKLNISGLSTEWLPAIDGLKYSLGNILKGNTMGRINEILSLFSFKNAFNAFTVEFLFSKFNSALAFLGSSYGIAWIALAVIAAFNFKKLFKTLNWVYFVFLSAGFLALFISLGFIPEFAWSTERYLLHLFPLAYFWVIRSYLSNTISLKSFAPEK